MQNAKVLAVQVDGGNEVEAEEADIVGTVYPGERVDVLTRWMPDASHEETSLFVTLDEEYSPPLVTCSMQTNQ